MAEVDTAFATPSSRHQLLILLNTFTSDEAFQPSASKLANHQLMDDLLNSLLIDNSSTLCTIGLTVLVKLLPIFAVYAWEELKKMLPRLFAILARVICWKERPPPVEPSSEADERLEVDEHVSNEFVETPSLELRPDLGWQRLEPVFTASSFIPPSATYFSFLYYLLPCNLIRFLRGPSAYLNDRGYQTPFTVSWEDALDNVNIRSKAEVRCCSP